MCVCLKDTFEVRVHAYSYYVSQTDGSAQHVQCTIVAQFGQILYLHFEKLDLEYPMTLSYDGVWDVSANF